MMYIGFIKEYDNNIRNAIPFSNFINAVDNMLEEKLRSRILQYLNEGVFLAGLMSYVLDYSDNQIIGTHDYFTDGYYVWPSYYPFLLNKYKKNVGIEEDFVSHVQSLGYKMPNIGEERLNEIDDIFTKEWQGKY